MKTQLWAVIDKETKVIDLVEHDQSNRMYRRTAYRLDGYWMPQECKVYRTRQEARDMCDPTGKVVKISVSIMKK